MKRRIGKTDLYVTPVALGCWPIAGMTSLDVNDTDSIATIHAAIDSGINFLDTAHCYGIDGESERLIGQAISSRRDELVIASKGGIHWDSNRVRHYDGSKERLIHECETSLIRMGIDTIDLHYLHAPDPNIAVEKSAEAFADLLDTGKIRSVGVSNFNVDQLNRFHDICPISALQPPYNILQRDIESTIVPWCTQRTVSVISYWPLMKGLLAGKIRRGHNFDPQDKRLSYEVFQNPAFEKAQCLLDSIDEIAKATGKTTAQVVVNWTIHQPGITSVLCGAKRAWQIKETAGAMGWELPQSHLKTMTNSRR